MIDNDDDLSSLDPSLADLFAAERRTGAPPPPGASDRVKGALALTVGVGTFGPVTGLAGTGLAGTGATGASGVKVAAAAAGAAGAKTASVVAATALAVTVGAGGVYVATRPADPIVDTAHVVVEQPVRPVSPLADPVAVPVAPPEPVAPQPVKPAEPVKPVSKPHVKPVEHVVKPAEVESAPVTPEERASRLQAERRLLESARLAVAKGDSAAAFVQLDEHRAQFKNGQLVEEREALVVQALAKAGRMDEARAQLASFKAKWPRSLFLKTLDAATSP